MLSDGKFQEIFYTIVLLKYFFRAIKIFVKGGFPFTNILIDSIIYTAKLSILFFSFSFFCFTLMPPNILRG